MLRSALVACAVLALAGGAVAQVETRPPKGAGQTPAFAGQTRAPERKADVAFHVVEVAAGLEHPWAIAFLPGGELLVTERPGRMRIVRRDGTLSPPVAGLPAAEVSRQGGLLDVALDPQFARNRLVYWSFSETAPGGAGNHTAVARGRLTAGAAPRLDGVQVIYRQAPSLASPFHFGSRLLFDRSGKLFVAQGERGLPAGRNQARNLDALLGKVVRLNADGSVPRDNPLVGREGARPEIWSYGHRNIQAAAFHPRTGALWEVEHGENGGDELNIIKRGADYGWPTVAYGIGYGGGALGRGTAEAGTEQPVYYWDPIIGPGGMAFYEGRLFPAWRGSLFVGALEGRHLVRLTLDGERVVGEERVLTGLTERVRDVRVGPDGALYLALENCGNGFPCPTAVAPATTDTRGRIVKLIPKR